jgi:hypothetical protein
MIVVAMATKPIMIPGLDNGQCIHKLQRDFSVQYDGKNMKKQASLA